MVDSDDPTKDDYPLGTITIDPPPGCMNAALNVAAKDHAIVGDASVIGFIGDDHRFRTKGWDSAFSRFLNEHPGIAYCDDLLQGPDLPTMWFVSRRIVDRFGMGLGGLKHLWIDNYWRVLGESADCLYYFPNIVIEHMHPLAGKAEWDDDYLRVNSDKMINEDHAVYMEWFYSKRMEDAATLRRLIAP